MALVFNHNKVGVENTSTTVTVPDDPIARLMYYLQCMCTVLSLNEPNINRLSNWRNYYLLNDEEKILVAILCAKLNPVDLDGLCLLKDEDVGDIAGRNNEFFNINAETLTFAAAESVVVGQKRVAVKKVMFYNSYWLNRYYIEPMRFCARLLEQNEANSRRTTQPAITYNQPSYSRPSYQRQYSDDDCCCTIL